MLMMITNHGHQRPTPDELAELERRFDGPIPAIALDDLRRETRLPVEAERSRARTVLDVVELNLRDATKRLRMAIDHRAAEATIRNARLEVAEWMDRVQDARAVLDEIEALALIGAAS